MSKNSTCNKCTQCGKSDRELDLEAHIVHGTDGNFVLLQCKKCLTKPIVVQKYGYKIPVYLPKNKTMDIIIGDKL